LQYPESRPLVGQFSHRARRVEVNIQRVRPSRWYYALAALVPLIGCLLAAVSIYQWFPRLPGTLDARMDLDNLAQVVVPGSRDIPFPDAGAYAVYYEHHSLVDGRVFDSPKTPPALDCGLTSEAEGSEIVVVPDYVKTNAYSTRGQERVGVLIGSITVDRPGMYTFSCRHADGSPEPEVVVAVGPNFVLEFFSIAARALAGAVGALAVVGVSAGVAAVIAIVIAVRRHRSRGGTRAGEPAGA
jgi:hypothetical protein